MSNPSEKAFDLPDFGTTCRVADLQSSIAVIATHPWGPLGGNLRNNVVVATVLYFQRLGITTCRFDFGGWQLSNGNRQVEQVQTMARRLLRGDFSNDTNIKPKHIILVGYSYGALIAASASADIPECIACVSVAPPFGVAHWLLCFHSQYHLERAAQRSDLPKLLILGDRDDFTSEKKFRQVVESYNNEEMTTGAIIKNADHFFVQREKDLMKVISSWITHQSFCRGDISNLKAYS